MKITKLDGHTDQGEVSFLEKKASRRVVKNYPKGDINDLSYNPILLHFFIFLHIFGQDYFALYYLEKQTFLQLAQASFKQQYLGIFHNFKVFLRKFPSRKLRFNIRHKICFNGFIYWFVIHDAMVLLILFLLLSACFFFFTLILTEENLKFQQMFKLKLMQILKIKDFFVHKCLQLFSKKTS